jgi:hypothetical protein
MHLYLGIYVYGFQVEEAVGLECEDKQDWEVAVKR